MFNDIDVIKKITLNENDVLIVRVARNQMPTSRWIEYTTQIKESLQVLFLSTRIVVVDNETDFAIIEDKTNGTPTNT